MTSPGINLLPPDRLVRLYERRVGRRWLFAVCTYLAGILVIWGMISGGVARESGVRVELAELEESIARKKAENKLESDALKARTREYLAAVAVGHHPDWSVLMTLAAMERGPDVTLEGCTVREADMTKPEARGQRTSKTTAKNYRKFEFEVSGLALQARQVHAYAIKLENSGLFDKVNPPKITARDPMAPNAPSLTAFTIVCELTERRQEMER